jgi:hypothetical protein
MDRKSTCTTKIDMNEKVFYFYAFVHKFYIDIQMKDEKTKELIVSFIMVIQIRKQHNCCNKRSRMCMISH